MPFVIDDHSTLTIPATPMESTQEEKNDLDLQTAIPFQLQASTVSMAAALGQMMIQREWFVLGPMDLKRFASLSEKIIEKLKPSAGHYLIGYMVWELKQARTNAQDYYDRNYPNLTLYFQPNPNPPGANLQEYVDFKIFVQPRS